MSEESERIYTINLGKVLLSQSQHRAVRAINMIREFARHHMKTEDIKIDEDLAHKIWARGVRSPPRKIRVVMNRTENHILVSSYSDDMGVAPQPDDSTPDTTPEPTPPQPDDSTTPDTTPEPTPPQPDDSTTPDTTTPEKSNDSKDNKDESKSEAKSN